LTTERFDLLPVSNPLHLSHWLAATHPVDEANGSKNNQQVLTR